MSEKYDGVRAYWDGSGIFTKAGRYLKVPDFFIEGLPAQLHLDGEL